MKIRSCCRWLLRPVVLGVLVAAACAAWHFRPMSRDVLIPANFRDGRWGYVNDAGRVAIPAVWEHAEPFDDNGLALVCKDSLWGWIDRRGVVKIPLEWDDALPFDRDGTARVGRKEKQQSATGLGIRESQIEKAGFFAVLRAVEKKWCCIDPAGHFVKDIDHQFGLAPRILFDRPFQLRSNPRKLELAQKFWGDHPVFWNNDFGSEGFFNKEGFAQKRFDKRGWATRKKNDKWGWVDRNDKVVLPLHWDKADDFDKHDMAAVCAGDKLGWIDRNGAVVVPVIWDTMQDFDQQGLARVTKNSKVGWIDRSGAIVIPVEWDDSWDFDGANRSLVRLHDKFGWVDRKGKVIIPVQWDGASEFSGYSDLALVCRNGHNGLIDGDGNIIVPVEWSDIEIHADNIKGNLVAWRNTDASRLNRCVEWIANGFKAPADRERVHCHVYDRSGRVVWRSDDVTQHLPVLIGALALGVAGVDGLRRLWRLAKRGKAPA
jgi:hypothetical protein